MYRFFILALVLTVSASFMGCGAPTETAPPSDGSPAVSTPTEAPDETASAAQVETAPEASAALSGDEASVDDADDWGEFEVIPSASASAQKKE
jgi:hypothetical protein